MVDGVAGTAGDAGAGLRLAWGTRHQFLRYIGHSTCNCLLTTQRMHGTK